MKKKIINLNKAQEDHKCLICCEKPATTKLIINRPKHDDNITTFYVCDECIAQMQKDIQTCE